MNTNKIMTEKQQLEFLKKTQKDKIFENIQSIERYIELLKEQLRADSLDDFNINFIHATLKNIDGAFVNYKIVDNQIKLIERVTKGE